MTAPEIIALPFISTDKRGAAAACGVSIDVITRAINAGALETSTPVGTEDGRAISKPLILATDLLAWIARGKR